MHFKTLALAALFSSAAVVDATRRYSTVKGYFKQDDFFTDPSTFDPIAENFGLKPFNNKPDDLTNWEYFRSKVDDLNARARRRTSYKVIFMARHGEGIHNVADKWYGVAAWYAYWARQDGNGTVVWKDAKLTDTGKEQTEKLSAAWQYQLDIAKMPAPQSYYTSPLYRCLDTARITFANLALPSYSSPFVPTVKEKLRETIGVVTPDQRSNRTYIQSEFPTYEIEEGFTEEDELWKPYELELPHQMDIRSKELLDDVFSSDDSTFISFTSHRVSTSSMLRVIGHRPFDLNTGGVIPVLIKSVE